MTDRNRISLDGTWHFWIDPDSRFSHDTLPDREARLIDVPAPWQSASADLSLSMDTGWYRRTLVIPDDWLSSAHPSVLVLGIDAADYRAEAWLNGAWLGEHEGGYLPFEFEITQAARPGENSLVVRVSDPPELFSQVPHGKQSWYGPLSGLWQSVWVEHRSPAYLKSIQLQPNLASRKVRINISLAGLPSDDLKITAFARDPQGETLAGATLNRVQTGSPISMSLVVSPPQPWSPEHPALYMLEVSLHTRGETCDTLTRTFGFRTIEARAGRLFLNDEPLYLRGALDQDYYPGTIATPPSLEFLEDQVRKARELGLNLLRCHIKAPDPRYYEVADRLGMLVWTDLPSWSVFSPLSAQRGWETLQGMVERDGHHPSIIAWSIINEGWGLDLVNDSVQRAWLKETYQRLKALDPARLVVDNSPCEPNFHLQSDLDDFHYYRAIPGQRDQWEQFAAAFASRPAWTFSPHGDGLRNGQEPLVVSEFGNWGLPDPAALKDTRGDDPWWFETGQEWGQGVVYPHGVARRFHALGLEKAFGSLRGFAEATQWGQFNALKVQIETLRSQPEISGYVITELTDVHWECNGLLDLQRNPKAFHRALAEINADLAILPHWERLAYWSGERLSLPVCVVQAAKEPVVDGRLHWSLEGIDLEGWLPVPPVEAGQVRALEPLVFTVPPVNTAAIHRLSLELLDPQGRRLARNFLDLAIYPPRLLPGDAPRLFAPDPALAEILSGLGYRLTPELGEASLAISVTCRPDLLDYVRDGGRWLLLADRYALPGPALPGIRVEARRDTPWAGEWVSAFAWLQREGPFARLPGGPLVDLAFERAMPEFVLTGFHSWDYRQSVPAGMVVGWIHKPAALIGERFFGRGRAVINTFHLPDEDLGGDPTATALLDSLIEWSA